MILERGQIVRGQFRVADHGTVGADEGDARGNESADGVRFGVELRGVAACR